MSGSKKGSVPVTSEIHTPGWAMKGFITSVVLLGATALNYFIPTLAAHMDAKDVTSKTLEDSLQLALYAATGAFLWPNQHRIQGALAGVVLGVIAGAGHIGAGQIREDGPHISLQPAIDFTKRYMKPPQF